MASPSHILIISHRRSGTHLLIDTIRNNLRDYRADYLNLDTLAPWHEGDASPEEFERRLSEAPRLVKTHAGPDIEAYFGEGSAAHGLAERLLDQAKVVYVVRDGRDVLTSLYCYRRRINPEAHDGPFGEFIRKPVPRTVASDGRPMDRVAYWKWHVEGWLGRQNVLAVRFDELIGDNRAALRRLAEGLRVPPPKRHTSAVRDPSILGGGGEDGSGEGFFGRLGAKLGLGRSAVQHTSVEMRGGRVGDHIAYFAEADSERFNAIAGDLMERLGYS